MGVRTGQELAQFSIERKLGEGGMGEVWLASDSRLDRKVAIKVLPDVVAGSAERLARFEREAKALAALNHPNVAGIHQVEEADGVHFLVMELAEGQTLAQRLQRGPLEVEEALRIALQIAEALEAAHDRGIVHRDLKPANVMLSRDGTVKVLDFGLARAMDSEPGETPVPGMSLASHSPTFTAHMTSAGMLMGTAAYMSPEQARGDVADRRADIWAFGVVLMELLTGETVYAGKTVSDTLAGVLARDPAWEKLPEDTPAPIRRLLERCLDKDVRERLQAIGEARIAIRDYLADPTGAAATTTDEPAARTGPSTARMFAIALPLVVVAAVAVWFLKPGSPPPPPRTLEMALEVEGQPLMAGIASSVVLSRDGSRLAYFTGVGTNPTGRIRVRDMYGLTHSEIDMERAYNVFFSPDGTWLGFVTPNQMYKVALSGGSPLELARVNRSRGASWGDDGTIVYAPNQGSGLMRIPATGGEPVELTRLEEGEASHRFPHHLPGGGQVLYAAYESGSRDEGILKAVDVATGATTLVHRGGNDPRYVASGHVLFWRDGTIYAAPYDPRAKRLTATAIPVVQGVVGNAEGGAQFTVDAAGTLVYLAGESTQGAELPNRLTWLEPNGNGTPITTVEGQFAGGLSLSPQADRVAVTRWIDGNGDIWVIDLARETPTRFTFSDAVDIMPRWSPDGRTIYFSSQRDGHFKIYAKAADGSDEARLVVDCEHDGMVHDVSRDGRWLLVVEDHPETQDDIRVHPVDGAGDPIAFVGTRFEEDNPAFSPDGRWIAYDSDESGRSEVYIRPFPGPGGKWQASSDGGVFPRWSADGRRLAFVSADGRVVHRLDVETSGAALQIGRPEPVVEFDPRVTSRAHWLLHPDGERVGVVENPRDASSQMAGAGHVLVRVTYRWLDELERILEGTP